MRILILHSQYLSGSTSGENMVVEAETRLLREAGHHVRLWSSAPRVERSFDLIRLGAEAIWSRSATSALQDVVNTMQPDIIHHHNLFPTLSPAVLRLRGEAATLGTLHNFRHLCLPGTLLRDNRICEDCIGHSFPWPGVVHRCYRGSHLGSATMAASLALHRSIGTFDRPSLYLAVSQFIKHKYAAAGWNRDQIVVKGNFAWPTEPRQGPGSYFLYAGRLSVEKGVATLLRAWKHLSHTTLKIAGDGPEKHRLGRSAPGGIEFLGSLPAADVGKAVRGARAVLIPSQCYEGQPRIVLEAYAAGVPVIASAIGGLPETVDHDFSGLLVRPDAVDEWVSALERMHDDGETERLGKGALSLWRDRYSPEVGLRNLESVYAIATERAE
jgi:glycosyltransferase involved in cell wall biosynthesis